MSDNVAVRVSSVSKTFKLPHENNSGLKQFLINRTKKNTKKGYETQHVLKGVSFDVEKGDFFGIVGRNGSGKSTLLKIISGIYNPDKGGVEINGSLTPFIELGVGFNPELTGRENVFLNGALLGFSRAEMEAIYDKIVSFAELERFMDQKLKNYSSGMQVRLAFSIAIQAKSDILVLDEVLAVGDEAFQRKCNIFFNEIKKDKTKTVILVTHDMQSVKRYCNKAIMVSDGRVVANGSVDSVANAYSMENILSSNGAKTNNKINNKPSILRFDLHQVSKPRLSTGQYFECELSYESSDNTPLRFGISIMDAKSNYPIMNDWIKDDKGAPVVLTEKPGRYRFNYKWKIQGINTKELVFIATLYGMVEGETFPVAFISMEDGINFFVENKGRNNALIDQEGRWKRLD